MSRTDARIPPHFLVVVPGMMGSKLRDRRTGRLVWLDFEHFPKNPFQWDDWVEDLMGRMVYPNDDLEPDGIMDQVMIMSPWAKQEQYGRLLDALAEIGYQVDGSQPEAERQVHTFAYDWRQDIRISGRLLGEAIERWHVLHHGAPAWVIGHSMGGIAARWYIEKEGGKDFVERLFLMASPWNGSPKAMQVIFHGLDVFVRANFNPLKVAELTRKTIRTFPSAYQILPHQGYYLRDGRGHEFDPLEQSTWLQNDAQRALLADARRFNAELGDTLSVETLCFFGRKRPTFIDGIAQFDASGEWLGVEWEKAPSGDGSVLESSAVHDGAVAKLPFVASHGSIYVHPGVLEVLQWELRDKYLARAGATRPVAPAHRVITDCDQAQYLPGSRIQIRTVVEGPLTPAAEAALKKPLDADLTAAEAQEALEAVRDGRIHVQLAWRSGLPGNPPPDEAPDVVFGVLRPGEVPGEFVGELQAPLVEGYYNLLTEVWIDESKAIDSDLVLIDDLIYPRMADSRPD